MLPISRSSTSYTQMEWWTGLSRDCQLKKRIGRHKPALAISSYPSAREERCKSQLMMCWILSGSRHLVALYLRASVEQPKPAVSITASCKIHPITNSDCWIFLNCAFRVWYSAYFVSYVGNSRRISWCIWLLFQIVCVLLLLLSNSFSCNYNCTSVWISKITKGINALKMKLVTKHFYN